MVEPVDAVNGQGGLAGRHWVARTKDVIQVGKKGRDGPVMHLSGAGSVYEILSVKFSSDEPATWQIYTPCF